MLYENASDLTTMFKKRWEDTIVEFESRLGIDTSIEIEYYRNGGILHTVLRQMLKERM